MNGLMRVWQAYIRWCDKLGLTPENRRCCMPRLEEPPLIRAKKVAYQVPAQSSNGDKTE